MQFVGITAFPSEEINANAHQDDVHHVTIVFDVLYTTLPLIKALARTLPVPVIDVLLSKYTVYPVGVLVRSSVPVAVS